MANFESNPIAAPLGRGAGAVLDRGGRTGGSEKGENAGPGERIAGVILGMDGVLLESEPFIAEAAVRMFAEKGVRVSAADFRPFVGMGEDRFLGGVAERKKVKLDMPRDKERTYEIYLDLIGGRLELLPGVSRFLTECERQGLKTAVASGADRIQVEANLREIGLSPSRFDALVVGEDIKRKKPAPDVFLETARRMGLDPRNCLVVDDIVAGVVAAKAAGARCLGLTTSYSADQLRAAGADWTADNLADASLSVLAW